LLQFEDLIGALVFLKLLQHPPRPDPTHLFIVFKVQFWVEKARHKAVMDLNFFQILPHIVPVILRCEAILSRFVEGGGGDVAKVDHEVDIDPVVEQVRVVEHLDFLGVRAPHVPKRR